MCAMMTTHMVIRGSDKIYHLSSSLSIQMYYLLSSLVHVGLMTGDFCLRISTMKLHCELSNFTKHCQNKTLEANIKGHRLNFILSSDIDKMLLTWCHKFQIL